MKKLWWGVMAFFSVAFVQGQNTASTLDYVYKSGISFPLVYRTGLTIGNDLISGDDLSMPIIALKDSEVLKIEFDDLNNTAQVYSYQIIHCTHDWQPSDLLFMQYMQGYETYDIYDYHFSSNTTISFTHYEFTFPNEQMKPLISGNFLVKVFEDGNPENVVFTRRFMIAEDRVKVAANIRWARDSQYRNSHQEIGLSIDIRDVMIQDVYNDLKVNIVQNMRWDNAKISVPPQFVSSQQVNYDHVTGETRFEAGNQWRYLDLKTMRLITEPILKFEYDNGRYHAILRPDKERFYRANQFNFDINGQFIIYNQDTYGTRIDPDYIYTYFSFPMDEPLMGKDLYVIGGFTFGENLEKYKMKYNPELRQYELTTLLKQGYYNYMYAVKDRKTGNVTFDYTEGNFAETENNYTIFIYGRQPGDLVHKLLKVVHLNSFKNMEK